MWSSRKNSEKYLRKLVASGGAVQRLPSGEQVGRMVKREAVRARRMFLGGLVQLQSTVEKPTVFVDMNSPKRTRVFINLNPATCEYAENAAEMKPERDME